LVPSAKKAGSQTCQIHSVFIANVVMQAKWGWAKSGYTPDMKVTKEKLFVLGYPLEFIIEKW
jgi:hypothetical protein